MNSQIFVANMLIQETGTFNQLYARPYAAHTTNESLEILSRRLESTMYGDPSSRVMGSLIAGISSGLVMPDASWERRLSIPNGWNERRLRFIMEVHVQAAFNTQVYYLQGYSDHVGVSATGFIDPQMPFFINSYVRVGRSTDYTNVGMTVDRVSEMAQVINGQFHITDAISGQVFTLRPEDLMVGIQSNYFNDAFASSGNPSVGNMLDTRTRGLPSTVRSNRSNSIPSNFIANYISGYRRAAYSAEFGRGDEDVYTRTIQDLHEPSPYENPFIRALSQVTGIPNTTTFTMSDLVSIDPDAVSSGRVSYQPARDVFQLHQTGQTEDWGGTNLKTQLATLLINSVSGLMIDCMLKSIALDTTTLTVDGQPYTRIINAQSFTNMNLSAHFVRFIERFNSEILPDVTYNGSFAIDAVIMIDLHGQSSIDISVDGDARIPYAAPSFCDSIFTPVVTTDANRYHDLVNGMEYITKAVESAVPRLFTAGGDNLVHDV
jgi:hypothetical protein